jgi:hypothetical protein
LGDYRRHDIGRFPDIKLFSSECCWLAENLTGNLTIVYMSDFFGPLGGVFWDKQGEGARIKSLPMAPA